jgi:hypothetical protein
MTGSPVHIGPARIHAPAGDVHGDYVSIGAERYYRIANYDRMPPFFMSVVSSSNHWLFISSNGGMTAGRRNADNALFPYYTEDKIHDNADHTGSRTIVRVAVDGTRQLWEPFNRQCGALYHISRNLYKNVYGNALMFEEVHHDLELVFRYTWTSSDRFGFVKRAELRNTGSTTRSVELLDGIENILPWGVVEFFQSKYSCLGDAYKQNELETDTGIATFAFSSIPGDSPEPAEALRATVCWSTRPAETVRLLSSLQLDTFRSGGDVEREIRMCGRRGSYFIHEAFDLAPGAREDWLIVADVEYGHQELASLKRTLATATDVMRLVQDDIDGGTDRLAAIVGRADGLQQTGDTLGSSHHFANVLFNVMRGGVFESAYAIPVADLKDFVRAFNQTTWARHEEFLDGLSDEIALSRLLDETRSRDDPALLRLVFEYLPISFSRRHGDPSRPWNQFAINVKNRDGSKVLDYQGNWRDIFQNWEALCLSFPEFLESVISRFVNTTTADGYNPYRVTKDGYDWEAPDPDDPWAHFGYWGDHQLIYLLKFLEWSRRHHPGRLERMLGEQRFVYADVPYDIKPYDEILADPRASITYNIARAERIAARVDAIGFDGRYLTGSSGDTCHANLAEKLLVPLLAKVANFVPGGGFWMNTQRPEWNDANNALAGYGVSMVTLYYARRYVAFCRALVDDAALETVDLNEEVAGWLQETHRVLTDHRTLLDEADIGDADRKTLLDGLGRAAEHYRTGLYEQGLRGQHTPVSVDELLTFLDLTLAFFDQTIRLNRRDDALYHAYNVLELRPDGVAVERLHPMLEGQVAVLSSGALSPAEALSVARALRHSDMYRADQHSYLLYPERMLPSFFEKNTIPAAQAKRSDLLRQLIADGNTDLVERDVDGAVHFNGLFRNIRDVRAALDRLGAQGYGELVARESALIADLFEAVFEHKRFTGRSGTFYGYEGIGCIYWHMVSKLLLAAQESCLTAAASDDPAFDDLAAWYYDMRAGIGFNKAPDVYGAFPTDPYSHTPGYAGAKQPGMTGQVKEEIITRLGELGVSVRDGTVRFDPVLLRRSEFLREPQTFEYYDVAGRRQSMELAADTLAFTYCQVPIVYRRSDEPHFMLHFADGTDRSLDGLVLDADASAEVFRRSGKIVRIEVSLAPGLDG